MEYDYKKYNHRSKSLKSADKYLTKFYENLELDYDDIIYESTVKNLMDVKALCDNISDRINKIVSQNSKELNDIKYTYLSLINSVIGFKWLNFQAVVDASKCVDNVVNSIITSGEFTYAVAEKLPEIVLKQIFVCSVQSNNYEYLNYLHSLDIPSLDVLSVCKAADVSKTVLYSLVLYKMLWDAKLKPMGKYHSKYYLSPDSMYEFVSGLDVSEELLDYYISHKDDDSLIGEVGLR